MTTIVGARVQFPAPDATFSEVTAFYEKHNMECPQIELHNDDNSTSTPTWHDIDGAEYCNKKCRGWDGKSYRCDCGHYRCHFTGDAPGAVGTC